MWGDEQHFQPQFLNHDFRQHFFGLHGATHLSSAGWKQKWRTIWPSPPATSQVLHSKREVIMVITGNLEYGKQLTLGFLYGRRKRDLLKPAGLRLRNLIKLISYHNSKTNIIAIYPYHGNLMKFLNSNPAQAAFAAASQCGQTRQNCFRWPLGRR